jgi:hypothetical protein
MKCLSIDPAERFQCATDVLLSLESAHHSRSTRRWVAFGAGAAAVVIGIATAWPHRSSPRATKDLSAVKDLAPTAPAMLPQPTISPQLPVGTDHGQAADRLATRDSEMEAPVHPHSQSPVPASQSREISVRDKVARTGAARRAAHMSRVLPAAEQATAEVLPTSAAKPSASGQDKEAKEGDAEAGQDPADRIFNPFANRGSTP